MASLRTRGHVLLGLAGWLAATFAAGAIGAAASVAAPEFYRDLVRPSWAPPAWLFGPVWTTLYVLMGVAAWLVWANGHGRARAALVLFVVQLALNSLWTWLFFNWRLGALATVEIGVLWCLIVATLAAFWKIRPLAALMLVPYLAWVSFAAFLCLTVWRLNPTLL